MTTTVIPAQLHKLIEFRQRGLPGFATVNTTPRAFEPKLAFPWHLSLLLQCVDLIDGRLPSPGEQQALHQFEDKIDPLIKANGNALFLARVTHDALRELIWRVHDPEAANSIVQHILRNKDYPREFDYRMDEDRTWQKAEWYLNAAVH